MGNQDGFLQSIWNDFINYDYSTLFLSILDHSFQILVIVLMAWILMKSRVILIRKIFDITKLDEKKENTLISLLLSLTRYVILIVAGMMILQQVGINMGPVLASAGVLGLAVGFGAQNLIKDVIAGFFIMFEDWMHVGDFVKVGEVSGTVEEIGLRSTVIREWSGKQVHLLNSSIMQLVNYNREKMRPIVSFNIPYEYSTDYVKEVIEEGCRQINEIYEEHMLKDTFGNIVEPVQLYGITDVENHALGAKYTVIGLVKDEAYWLMAKEIRKILLDNLRNHHIQVAYPKRVYSSEQFINELNETV